jgi:hypothetical protein
VQATAERSFDATIGWHERLALNHLPDSLDVRVTPNLLTRALRLWDQLLKAFESRGWVVEVVNRKKGYAGDHIGSDTFLIVAGERCQIRVCEKARALNDDSRGQKYQSIGVLAVEVYFPVGGELCRRDSQYGPVEGRLDKFLARVEQRVAQIPELRRRQEDERERRRIEWESELERLRLLREQEEAWAKFRRRRAERKAAFVADVSESMDRRKRARGIREFVSDARAQPWFDPKSRFARWLVRAEAYARRIDPLSRHRRDR